jgi:hypothetical protein
MPSTQDIPSKYWRQLPIQVEWQRTLSWLDLSIERFIILPARAICQQWNCSKCFGIRNQLRWRLTSMALFTKGHLHDWGTPLALLRDQVVLQMEFRLAELENPLRQHGIKLGDVAARKATVEELRRASLVMRAQSYRRRLFSEFERTKEVFLP